MTHWDDADDSAYLADEMMSDALAEREMELGPEDPWPPVDDWPRV
ncbi:hypothetical protein [Streptomyces sp. NRRL S-1896]|nr:hypothetical protein [Streptomyces sp. NRRL S-1896]